MKNHINHNYERLETIKGRCKSNSRYFDENLIDSKSASNQLS